MPTSGMPTALDFELAIDPNPRFVSVVRRFIEEAFERVVPEPDAVFRVSMTAHELLENASKYSSGGKAVLRVSFRAGGSEARVTICLLNQTTPGHVQRLRERIDALNAAGDVAAHYQRLMRESSRRSDESGLGLARIGAEGEMTLGLEITDGAVAIIASGTITNPGTP